MAKKARQELYPVLGKAAGIGALALITIIVAAACWPNGQSHMESSTKRPDRVEVSLGGKTHQLELAITPDEIRTGLMGRSSLPDDGGMLFLFEDEQMRNFWMGGCQIDLDILFLDAEGAIVSIHSLPAPPMGAPESQVARCYSAAPAQFVIELAAGSAERLGLQPGDRAEMDLAVLKALVR